VIEVPITGGEGEVALERGGGDPDIVLRDRPTFAAQPVLDIAIQTGGRLLARQNVRLRGEGFDLSEVLLDPAGLSRPEA
jgi:hypothetical protein